MGWFSCKACAARDAHIKDLKELVTKYEAFAIPKNDPSRLPAIVYEADAVLSGQQHIVELEDAPTPQTIDDAHAEQSERDRLLSGQY